MPPTQVVRPFAVALVAANASVQAFVLMPLISAAHTQSPTFLAAGAQAASFAHALEVGPHWASIQSWHIPAANLQVPPLAPPVLAPPALLPADPVPPALVPPAFFPAVPVSPALAPPALVPAVVESSPPELSPPEVIPALLELSPAALSPPELVSPALEFEPLVPAPELLGELDEPQPAAHSEEQEMKHSTTKDRMMEKPF
jgi:hypothetical protein